MLAYLLWHTPLGTDTGAYEGGLAAFHGALAASLPDGFVRSWTLRVDRPAWLPEGAAHYLDWYLVESYAALGLLNDAAVSGTRRDPHDGMAALARTGTAGLVGLARGVARRTRRARARAPRQARRPAVRSRSARRWRPPPGRRRAPRAGCAR